MDGGTAAATARTRRRVTLFDTLRGFTIISMVAFHACYDLAYLEGFAMPWFTGTLFQAVWRASISWTFLLLAGWMTCFSRNNVRRGLIYGVAALVVWIATSLAGVDTSVSFGILFCMAASTLIVGALAPLFDRVPSAWGLVISLALFALTYSVPLTRYPVEGLAWLGLPSPSFASGDYYPLMPFFFMYLAGRFVARLADEHWPDGYPAWMYRDWMPPLTAVGHASLVIYLVHQPILLLLTELNGH